MVGVWPSASGHVRIDGSDIDHWDQEKLGRFIGYVPQDVELFSGTVAENIARFAEVDEKRVIAASQMAGVHEMIQGLAQGYDTEIGEGGQDPVWRFSVSALLWLARSYGDPVMIVLDEPNAHLDTAGEEALSEAMKKMRDKDMSVIVITHKPNLLTIADQIMILMDGQLQGIGTREQMLPKLMGPKVVQAPPREQGQPGGVTSMPVPPQGAPQRGPAGGTAAPNARPGQPVPATARRTTRSDRGTIRAGSWFGCSSADPEGRLGTALN